MLRLLVDTCVWLDLAKDLHGQPVIAAVRVLVHQAELELLVPQVVIDEYDRNRAQVEKSVVASTRDRLRHARQALVEHSSGEAGAAAVAELDAVSSRGPLIEELALRNFVQVRELLAGGRSVEPAEDDHHRVVQRGIEKRAPFHHSKNSVADALLAEMYRTVIKTPLADPADRYGFVTHNTSDFSLEHGDTRKPHPDLVDCFEAPHSGYFTRLADVLALHFPEEYPGLIEESDFPIDVRSAREIMDAEGRFFDLIWYGRSLSHMDDVGAAGRARVEGTYPRDELPPVNDFEWGMLHGKLSTLRWVLGDEWDFLDT